MLNVTILGCSSSGGVPRVGQGWGKCDPTNPKNRRRRCSLLLSQGASATNVLRLFSKMPPLREKERAA